MYTIKELQHIAEQFTLQGDIVSIERINKGYINRTYKVETLSKHNHIHQYILQRINTNVFPDVVALMSNFWLTTEHLANHMHMPQPHKRGHVQTPRPTKDGKLYFAGESFGLQYCIKYLVDVYFGFGSSVPENLSASGSMYGHQIYNIENGGDVRIMSNNVWDCNSNKPAWEALGEDCSAKNRAIGLAATYMAYAPDVICLQEMSILMIGYIRKHLKDNGFAYDLLTYTVGSDADNTCILYRTDTLNLLDKGHHEYTYGNNGGSKSYTWGYFEQKATGKKFAALSTHMWYKSESAEPGSNKHRENQAAEIVAEMDKVIEKYGCPVFVMGDFNTRTNSEAFRVFLNGGFKNTYQLASVYADNHQGRHSCNADGFALEGSPGTYTGDAIDHILLKNGGETKIYTFDHARPYFYIKLSDHYPVFVDATLG